MFVSSLLSAALTMYWLHCWKSLKVQEHQDRVSTTMAIAVVAETCCSFMVLAALMNEYRVPGLNVQNGVLKYLSFLLEYFGEMGKDYIYAVTPL